MLKDLHNLYQQKLEAGELSPDPVQERAVEALTRLHAELMAAHAQAPRSFFERITGFARRTGDAPKGVYMYGGVGRGKSMLMDLFFSQLPDDMCKRRVHFHEFMIEVHDYIHFRRDPEGGREGVDATLPLLAERIAERSRVLCFDEFHVTDVVDAMILGRLFTALFDRDVVVVATSNWPPDKLYEGGLQRDRFLPFIDLLKRWLEVVHLDGDTDYRAQCLQEEGTYFTPLGPATDERIDAVFEHLTDHAVPYADALVVKGRTIKIDRVAKGAARFTFAQLCEQPLGAEDYMAIADKYHTVFLERIPKLSYDRRNEAKRLMTLIDVLYENHIRLVVSADAPADQLYRGHDHAFEFERTVSRLLEMGSKDYLEG